jgi:phosphatidylethanolamine-binding protein (PEBP) family uncharacterized protein
MRETEHLFAVAAAALLLAFAGTASKAADVFTLKSTTFEDGKMMPKRAANSKANQPNNPNCVGDNVSPEFSWSNVLSYFVLWAPDKTGNDEGVHRTHRAMIAENSHQPRTANRSAYCRQRCHSRSELRADRLFQAKCTTTSRRVA